MRLVKKLVFQHPAIKGLIQERDLLRNSLGNARTKLQVKDELIRELRARIATLTSQPKKQLYNGGLLPITSSSIFKDDFVSFYPKAEHDVAIFVKSYSPDFERLQQLVSSYRTFAHSIPLLLSVPFKEIDQAKSLFGSDITIIADEDYTTFGQHPHFYGWLNQQLCKLNLFKIGFAHAYLTVDSDSYFLKQLVKADLVHESGTNFSIFSTFDTNYRRNAPYYHDYLRLGAKYWPASEPTHIAPSLSIADLKENIGNLSSPNLSIRGQWIRKVFGVNHSFSFMPSPILSSLALQSLHDEFCVPNDITLSDLIAISPWEFNWYGEWLLYRKPIPIYRKDPIATHFPSAQSVEAFLDEGFTAKDLENSFSIVAMASGHYDRINV